MAVDNPEQGVYRVIFSELFAEKIGIIEERSDKMEEEERFRSRVEDSLVIYHEGEINVLEKLVRAMEKKERESILRSVHFTKKLFGGYVADPEKIKAWAARERRRFYQGVRARYVEGWRCGEYPSRTYPNTGLRAEYESLKTVRGGD